MILASALLAGVLFALAVHMIGQRFGLDLGRLWSGTGPEVVPIGAALAWWITAAGAFGGGYFAASAMAGATDGLPPVLRNVLIVLGVLVLAGAGQAAALPGGTTSASGVLAGVAALALGAIMSFCGAQFALRRG
jgi:hypothetical protein